MFYILLAYVFTLSSMIFNINASFSQSCNRPETSNTNLYPTGNIPHSLRVISYNIRSENSRDRQEGNSWELRKHKIKKIIDYYKPDIIGFQEVDINYMPDLEKLFPQYTIVTFNTDDTEKDSALLINEERFICKKTGFFWLAQDPQNKESSAWESRVTRLVVYAHLLDLQTQHECYVYCTHFDGYSVDARFKSAKTLVTQQKIISNNLPAIVLGDFNLFMDEQGEEIYNTLLKDNFLEDVRDVSKNVHYGPDGTWIGWSYDRMAVEPGTVGARLDNIFVHNFSVLKDGVLNMKVNTSEELIESHKLPLSTPYSSDHLPVIADIFFQ